MYVQSVLFVIALLKCCEGYSLGPPLSACGNMTPSGHPGEPSTSQPPFTFTLNATTYRPGDVIEVFLDASGDWFMEGTLVQVRAKDCTLNVPAVGTFETEANDVFLQKFNCFNTTASAIRHYSHMHIYNRTFYWIAPDQSVGDVQIRATIARNQTLYWTNFMSQTISDVSDNRREACGATTAAVAIAVLVTNIFIATILF